MSAGPPDWRLPPGVDRALWDYASSGRLAAEEAAYFADDPLTIADAAILHDRFGEPSDLIDLGCGAGRLSLSFARRGFRVVAVDLSSAMLGVLGHAAEAEGLVIDRVRSNLCRLDSLPDGRFDAAFLMYSTLGMISGASERQAALRHVARILKAGGRLALHAHNLWVNLRDPGGRSWLFGEFGRTLIGRGRGDRRATYRGIPGVGVHLFRWRELRDALRSAGLHVVEVVPLDPVSAKVIDFPRVLPSVRAGGWIVIASTAG